MRALTDHKTLGIAYGLTAGAFMLVGFLLMLLFRWQLAWPGQPIPVATAKILGSKTMSSGGKPISSTRMR
jgi:heme/copper-type cytochrome/quinol oxidase subunit 1